MYNVFSDFANLSLASIGTGALILFTIIAIWDGVWKVIGLWHSARNNQLIWFIFILLFNTAGILPIVYLIWFQSKEKKSKKN